MLLPIFSPLNVSKLKKERPSGRVDFIRNFSQSSPNFFGLLEHLG